MKKRTMALVLFCALLGVLCVSCARPETDYFDMFRAAYEAEVEGELNGVAFSALVEATALPAQGAREVTVTFYAPEGLKGTVVSRSAEGVLSLSVGDLTIESAADGFSPLFELFPVEEEVREVTLTDEGYTRVSGADFAVTFLADGTPCAVEHNGIAAKVITFSPALA